MGRWGDAGKRDKDNTASASGLSLSFLLCLGGFVLFLLVLCDMVHGCMVYTERAEMAAVSCGTSHASAVSTPLRQIFFLNAL